MLKRLGCCALAVLMILAAACAESGEYVVEDVVFHEGWDVRDGNVVFYEIFVGSFSDSDGDGIGDLRGIIDRMDYLNDGDPASGRSLGVGGIWLSPIFVSPSYHKYDVTDYYRVDPVFGTNDDLRELAELCHERGVLLIIDLPINHTGSQCRWYRNFCNAHLMQNPSNAYYDFYTWIADGDTVPAGRHFTRTPVSGLLVEANFSDSMPELNFDNEAVRQEMLKVARFWLDLGVDGFRFDAAKYIYLGDNPRSVAFWTWYLETLRAEYPDMWTVAEVWDSDGITDQYAVAVNCFNFTTSQASGLISETAQAGDVHRWVNYLNSRMTTLSAIPGARNVPFIANHDTDRAAGYLPVFNGRMQMAANLYILSPGSPFIYYGEELGMKGSRGSSNTDANRRLAMVWGDGDTVADPAGADYDPAKQVQETAADQLQDGTSLFTHYKRLLMIRRANPEIARGSFTPLTFPGVKVSGFVSEWNGGTVAVLHNTTTRTITVDLAEATDIPFAAVTAVAGMGGATLEGTVLTLQGQTSAVLR